MNWHTDKTGTQVGQTYRVRVSVAGTELGYANIKMARNGKEARNATNDETIGLVDGRTLPFKFRVETCIVGTIEVSPPEASVAAGETQPFTATLYDLHGELIIGPDISWSSGDTEIATVDDEGLATGISAGEVLIFAASGPAAGSAALTVFEDDNNDAFITTWDTSLGSGTTVTLALAGTVDATINWGDGTITNVTTPGPHTHDYGTDGIYTVSVTGSVTAYNSRDNGDFTDTIKLINVESWGALGFDNMQFALYSAGNLTAVPNNSKGLEKVTNMRGMFSRATSFNGSLYNWDVSNVTNMSTMFSNARSFNQPLDNWNVSSVTNMQEMFAIAISFDQPLDSWDVSNLTNMGGMFGSATSFDQPFESWNVSNVTDMSFMFMNAELFNQDLSDWCVDQITAKPTSFDIGASSWELPRPVWGTCPL